MLFKQRFMLNESQVSSSSSDSTVAPSVDASKSDAKPDEPAFKELKVNGKVIKVPLEKLDSFAQLGLSATEKFNEAKKERELAERLKEELKTSKSAFKSLEAQGYSKAEARAIIEEELRREYEEEDLSPDEKAKRAEKAELEKYRQAEAERKKQMEQEASSKEELAELEKIDSEIAEAIEQSDLPKNPLIGKFALNYMSAFAEHGEELSAKEAMKMVSADIDEIIKERLSQKDAGGLKQYLKTDHIKGLQDEVLKDYQSKQSPFSKPAVAPKPAQAEKKAVEQKVIRSKDFFKWD